MVPADPAAHRIQRVDDPRPIRQGKLGVVTGEDWWGVFRVCAAGEDGQCCPERGEQPSPLAGSTSGFGRCARDCRLPRLCSPHHQWILAQSGPDSPCDGESGEYADHYATDSEQRHGSVRPCHELKFFARNSVIAFSSASSGTGTERSTRASRDRPQHWLSLVITLERFCSGRLVCVPPSVERRAGVGERSLLPHLR